MQAYLPKFMYLFAPKYFSEIENFLAVVCLQYITLKLKLKEKI